MLNTAPTSSWSVVTGADPTVQVGNMRLRVIGRRVHVLACVGYGSWSATATAEVQSINNALTKHDHQRLVPLVVAAMERVAESSSVKAVDVVLGHVKLGPAIDSVQHLLTEDARLMHTALGAAIDDGSVGREQLAALIDKLKEDLNL